MIGDFVRINVNGMDAFIAQVFGIWPDGAIMTNGVVGKYQPEHVEPVILIDDMLNQIADYYENGDFWLLKGAWFILESNSRADGGEYLAYSDDEAMWRNDYFARCRYVHELQHILRVTGHADMAGIIK